MNHRPPGVEGTKSCSDIHGGIVAGESAGPDQRTIPRQMFSGLREQINPTILAVATFLIAVSICLLITIELLRRRSERLRSR